MTCVSPVVQLSRVHTLILTCVCTEKHHVTMKMEVLGDSLPQFQSVPLIRPPRALRSEYRQVVIIHTRYRSGFDSDQVLTTFEHIRPSSMDIVSLRQLEQSPNANAVFGRLSVHPLPTSFDNHEPSRGHSNSLEHTQPNSNDLDQFKSNLTIQDHAQNSSKHYSSTLQSQSQVLQHLSSSHNHRDLLKRHPNAFRSALEPF